MAKGIIKSAQDIVRNILLTKSSIYGIITTMKPKLMTIKIARQTHRNLKILSALSNSTMVDVLEQLVSEALKKVQPNDYSKSV